MPIGAGKYDDLCTHVLMEARADACILLIMAGKYGHGFEVQSTDPGILSAVPALLRQIADQIEADVRSGSN